MSIKILLILLTVLPLHALSATCPQGLLDGKVQNGGNYGEELYSCYQGKIYLKTLKYCAAENEDNKNWRGDDGFYNPLDSKCVEGKVIGKNRDFCSKGKLGQGGIYGNVDFYCNEGGIYSKLNNRKQN